MYSHHKYRCVGSIFPVFSLNIVFLYTLTELLSKGIPAGSGILNINGVDISKPDTPLKFVVTELQKLKNQPVKITFGVVKKTIIEDPLHYQEEAYWKTNDCLDVFNCGLNTYHEAS